jgi:alpha-glucosidase
VPADRVVDPGGRDGCRAPIPWTSDEDHGWPGGAWLPFAPDATARSVRAQTGDPASMLEHYRRLLALRRATPALHRGAMALLDAPEGVLRYRRWVEDGPAPQSVEVLINFTGEPVPSEGPDGEWSGGEWLAGGWLGGTALPGDPPAPGTPLAADEARIVRHV